ncbi:hypothetical protein FRB99_008175 [Tulasnella sp. 403]|nr:hypothetical protein FRB99_008175 [Tulasnella sp. 403]
MDVVSNAPLTSATVAFSVLIAAYVVLGAERGSKRPPVVPYWIPWLGSAIEMGKDPDGERYGDIFGIQAAGKRQYYVTSSTAINAIYKNSKSFVFPPTRLALSEIIFGMSHDSIYGGWMESSLFPIHHRLLSPARVGPLVDAFVLSGDRLLLEQRDAIRTDEHHTTLEAFIHKFMFKTIAAAFFGPFFPADEVRSSPIFILSETLIIYYSAPYKAYEPFLVFDDYFPLIAAEMPSFVTSKGFKARDVLIRLIEQYLEHPEWSNGAAELMKEMVEGSRNATPPYSTWDIAAMLNTDLWASEGNMSWAFFWAINLTLHEPDALTPLIAEVNTTLTSWLANNPCASLSNTDNLLAFLTSNPFPLIASHITEALRISSSSFSIRTTEEDGACAGGYEFKRGDKLICVTRSLHLDEDVYPEPYTFKGDRFFGMNASESGGKRPYLPFGGGVSQCEGRHFAARGTKALFALVLLHFDIQLDPSVPSKINFDMTRIGTGVLHPSKPTHIIVRKKQLL